MLVAAASRRGQECGFSLIEALVVVSILGLMLVTALPSMAGWVRSLNVRTTAEYLQNGVQRARMEALRRNQETSFWLVTSPTSNSCATSSSSGSWVVVLGTADPSGACGTLVKDGGIVVERYELPASYSAVNVAGLNGAATTTGVAFNVFGQVKTGGTPLTKIKVTHTTDNTVHELDVDVAPGGLIRMCDPSVGASDSRACPDAT